jgi:squalene-hopene/tetraprenyl-beta-curcumene cyclase
MNSRQPAPRVAAEQQNDLSQISSPNSGDVGSLGGPVRRAIGRTRQWLLDQQCPDGSWCGELQGDTILESETILLLAFLGREDSQLAKQAAAYLIDQQLPDGGWAMYPGGEMEISGSVKAYFALKLTGHDPGGESMQRARAAILSHGGADAVNSFTRFYLALLGQISYEQCPAVPPEIVLLPKWFPLNLYALSAWSRTMLVPLSIISAMRPARRVEPRYGIRELFLQEPQHWPALHCPGLSGGTGLLSWNRFFRTIDGLLKWCQKRRLLPLRHKAIAAAERWMIERFDGSDGLGAIYPPMVWSLVALKCLGYPDDSLEVTYCCERLQDLVLEDAPTGKVRVQPCKSPVWDTAITVRALAASGIRSDNPAMRQAVAWLLARQVRRFGDWAETVQAEPGGWCFEYANDFYPDCDDTAMVLMALHSQFSTASERHEALPAELRLASPSADAPAETCGAEGSIEASLAALVGASTDALMHASVDPPVDDAYTVDAMKATVEGVERGLRWLLAMQNRDGGWGAFDRDNDHQCLCHVPFADHNAMIDPSTPDLTGRVLEALGTLGQRVGDAAVDRAVACVRRAQNADGSWYGRWGVNYVYGTWQAISGLAAVGVPHDDPSIAAGAQWLLAHQQACGGWGESPDSYAFPARRGQGPPTASQTAWAVMGLIAAGLHEHPAAVRAVRYLLSTQADDGTWEEAEFTGTGFPQVFYLRYHYYRIYFPLLALSHWAVAANPKKDDRDPQCILSFVSPASSDKLAINTRWPATGRP